MKKIDTQELRELLEITENAQRVRNYSADEQTRKIADDVLAHVAKRVKSIRKGGAK